MNNGSVTKNIRNQSEAFGKQQHGVVLVIALIMLLLLTMIGIAGIRDTQLQEKMAGGAQDRELALQAAESALRVAEAQLQPVTVTTCAGLAACIVYTSPTLTSSNSTGFGGATLNRVESTYWQNTYPWLPLGASSTAAPAMVGVATPPRYVIEQLPQNYTLISGTKNVTNKPSDKLVIDYLITARGTGTTDNAVVILQSMYRAIR